MIILIAAYLILCCILFHATENFTLLESMVLSVASLFLASFILVEVLSLWNLLNSTLISLCWIVSNVALLLIALKVKAFNKIMLPGLRIGYVYIFVLLVITITFVTAVLSPITNTDSLTYHLSRVMYWIQNENISQFATNNHRQVSYQPLAEYLILNIKLLGGSDSVTNLVQWICFVGCLFNGFRIAELLNLTAVQRKLTVFLIATIPMGILQASSTQNDLVAAFFVSLFFVGYLKYKRLQSLDSVIFLVAGVALGGFVKGTVYIFILPFCVDLVLLFVKKTFWKNKFLTTHVFILVGGFLLVNGAYFLRNYQLFGSIFGTSSLEISNEIYGLRPFFSNVTRQFTLQLGMWSPGNFWNDLLLSNVSSFHEFLGLNISDPRITFGDYDIKRFSLNEDYANNTIHFILIVSATLHAIFNFSKAKSQNIWLMIWGGFFVFVILIKWQVFANRLFLPWFVISMPMVAKSVSLSKWRLKALAIFITLVSLPFLLLNSTRPLISYNFIIGMLKPTEKLSFADQKTLGLYRKNSILLTKGDKFYAGQESLMSIIDVTNNLDNKVQKIGLDVHRDFEDYPLLKKVVPSKVTVKHVFTEEPFNTIEDKLFTPQLILSTENTADSIFYNKRLFKLEKANGQIKIYRLCE
jgi:hypothetical protein